MFLLFKFLLFIGYLAGSIPTAISDLLFKKSQQNVTISGINKTYAKPVVAHVFIHGTRLPGFIFLDPQAAFKHRITDDGSYVKTLTKIRSDERFFEEQVILEEGLQEIPEGLINYCRNHGLCEHLRKRAAIHVISAYDSFINKNQQIPRYYTYGWIGVLDDGYRQRDARVLYQALVNLRNQLKKEYPHNTVTFVLHGHSHGGNVILYLGKYEEMYKQKLVVDHAILYGTPIQQETVAYCLHPMFNKIAIFYSYADKVQIADKFSTKSKTSCRRFSDLMSFSNNNHIQEVCVCAQGSSKAFGHASYFYLDEYTISRAKRGVRPYHHVYNLMNPLPVVAFTPPCMQLLNTVQAQEPTNNHFTLNFETHNKNFSIMACGTHSAAISKDIAQQTHQLTQQLEKGWRPYIHFNYPNKTLWMLKAVQR